MSFQHLMNSKQRVAAICGALVITSIFLNGCENTGSLEYAPKGLGISNVLYVKTNSWGFGPGGNETGVIVYELPESAATEIKRSGVVYLESLSKENVIERNDLRGVYNQWRPTPMLLEGVDRDANQTYSYDIGQYLNRYGFGIEFDPKVKQEINEAISHPGNFSAFGRVGVAIVIPESRKVVYAYNG